MAPRGGPSRSLFDVWSRFYDLPVVQRAVYRPVQDAVLADLGEPEWIVDVGCGTGLMTSRLARERPGAAVVGVDFSAGMLEQAAARDRRVGWVQGDAMRLPLADRCADAVTCTESFHWYPDQPAALAELHRVLRPGGTVQIALVNPPLDPLSRVAEAGSRLAGQPARWPSRRRMREMVAAAGFTVEAQRTVLRPPAGLVLAAVLTIGRRRQDG